MKKILLFSFCVLLNVGLIAQIDTVLYEDFQLDVFLLMDDEATGDNVNWVNYDADGLTTNAGTEETKKWYGGEALSNAVDSITGETNFVAISTSYLDLFLPGNRNWMILPPLEISDDSYMLHWKSAPSQLPRYMDGYQVLLSVGTNDLNAFADTLFTAASMDQITGDGQSTDYSNFSFTPGYLHANGGMDTNYFVEGTTAHFGLLEPHSVDLSSYAGQTVYIAFFHDSDDDERIQIDDILLTKAGEPSSVNNLSEKYRFESYPNPVDAFVNLNFRLDKAINNCIYSIFSTQGKLVTQVNLGQRSSGIHTEKINLSSLPSGNYVLKIELDGDVVVKNIVKR